MVEVNSDLFKKLRNLLPRDSEAEVPPVKRWITTTPFEKEWLKNIKLQTDLDLVFGDQRSLSLATFQSENYLISVGLDLDLAQEDFEEISVNAGIFCAVICDLNVNPIGEVERIAYELLENVFIPSQSTEAGVSYFLSTVEKYFPKIRIFKIRTGSPLLDPMPNLLAISLFAVTKCSQLITLKWSANGLENARAISSARDPFLPFELVLRAIIEKKNTHAFLELYRCIEFLFPFPKINELKKKLKLTLPSTEISELVEETLGWRPTEGAALKRLFVTLPQEILSELNKALWPKGNKTEVVSDKVAELLYRLRNDCVHFRPIQRTSDFQVTVNWELLLQTLLLAISSLYSNHVGSKHLSCKSD